MVDLNISLTISYEGNHADNHEIDFYDIAQALIGFQRSLALTTHLVLNNKVITHAPALKGAQIFSLPPEEGSWKTTAVILSGLYAFGTAPKDTPVGNLARSAYEYVIAESLGFSPDYEKTLGQQYKELEKYKTQQIPILNQSRFDSVIEKCEVAIKQMHRPIVESETASTARILYMSGKTEQPLNFVLNAATYEFIETKNIGDEAIEVSGLVSGYNSNTFKGRLYIEEFNRSIPFELHNNIRDEATVKSITENLAINAVARFQKKGFRNLRCSALLITSSTGQLKGYLILAVNGSH